MVIHCSSNNGVLKKVRFAEEEDNDVILFTREEAGGPLWLSSEEYKVLRQHVRNQAAYLKLKGYGVLLKNCFEPTARVQKQINAMTQLPGTECPRGAEQYLSKHHGEECDRNNEKVRGAVLSRQMMLRRKETPAEIVVEKLRSASKKHSRSSKIFARRLGLADERAVEEGDDLAKARELVKALNLGNAKIARRQDSFKSLKKSNDPTSEQGVAKMVCFPYSASKFDKAEHRLCMQKPTGSKACSAMIQSALELLELDDDVFSKPLCSKFISLSQTNKCVPQHY